MREDVPTVLTYVSGRMAHMTQLVSSYCLCRLISDDMTVVETICLWIVVVYYCGGCVPLIVTMCQWLVAMCYLVWLCTTG
jgi:hypothetical protein